MTSMEIRKPDPAELAIIMKLSPQSMFEGTRGRAELSEDKIKQLIEPTTYRTDFGKRGLLSHCCRKQQADGMDSSRFKP